MQTLMNYIKAPFKKKAFSAREAYMTTKYGEVTTTDKLLDEFYKSTESLIKSKAMSGKFCAMAEIDSDICEFTEDIIKYYKSLGYQVLKLTDKTMINGEKLRNIKSTYIILVWSVLSCEEPVQTAEEIA